MGKTLSGELVSIIMPAYNSSKTIASSILSATAQTYKNIELIIIDDGSTDNTVKICQQYANKDSRIKLIKQQNKGVSTARNVGIINAFGEFVSFLDADDLWEPDKIELQFCVASQDHETVILTGLQRFSGDGSSRQFLAQTYPPAFSKNDEYTRKILRLANNEMASFGTALVKKKHLEETGLFDEKLVSSEDWELWLRLAFHFPFANIDKPLRLYRKHTGSLTTRTNLRKTLLGQIYVIEKHAEQGDMSRTEIQAAKALKYFEFAGFFWARKMRITAFWSAANGIASSPGESGRLFRKVFVKVSR